MELYNFLSTNRLIDLVDPEFLKSILPVARYQFEDDEGILYRAEIKEDIVYAYIFDDLVAKYKVSYDWYNDYMAIIPDLHDDLNPEIGYGRTKYAAQLDLLENYSIYNIEALWSR